VANGNATTTDSVGGATVVDETTVVEVATVVVGATVVDETTVVEVATVVVGVSVVEGASVVVGVSVVVGAGVLLTAVIVNASYPPARFLKFPAATQFPADAHDTELKKENGFAFCTPLANTAGVA
jgi:hypothetical protein